MRVLMVLGPYAGQVVEWDTPVAETLIGTGEAEAYTEPAPEPEPEEVSEPEPEEEGGDDDEADEVDLAGLTVSELEDLGDAHDIEASDIDGSGAGGRVLKADWVRVLEVARDAPGE